jgi:hypothetical protein
MKTLKELNEIISSIDIIGVKSLMTKQSKQWLLNISVKGNNVERERERDSPALLLFGRSS